MDDHLLRNKLPLWPRCLHCPTIHSLLAGLLQYVLQLVHLVAIDCRLLLLWSNHVLQVVVWASEFDDYEPLYCQQPRLHFNYLHRRLLFHLHRSSHSPGSLRCLLHPSRLRRWWERSAKIARNGDSWSKYGKAEHVPEHHELHRVKSRERKQVAILRKIFKPKVRYKTEHNNISE